MNDLTNNLTVSQIQDTVLKHISDEVHKKSAELTEQYAKQMKEELEKFRLETAIKLLKDMKVYYSTNHSPVSIDPQQHFTIKI